MDTTKIFTVLCAILLLICLVLTVTSLVIMHQTLDKSLAFQGAVSAMAATRPTPQESTDEGSPDDPPPADVEADVLYNRFTLKEHNGQIGVYSEDGYLIRTFEVEVSTLPREARDALEKGVTLHSWRELMQLIEAFES